MSYPNQFFVEPTIPVIVVYVFLFLVFSGVELWSAFLEKEKIRKIIKPFCVLVLMMVSLLTFPTEYFLWIGLLCGVIGDVFFIFKDNEKCVYLGMFFFLVNHILFISEGFHLVYPEILPFHFYIIAGVYAVFLIFGFFVIRKVLKLGVPMALAASLYMTFLVLDFGVQVYGVSLGYSYLWIGVIGGLLFMGSDAFLSYTLFLKDVKRKDFYIMLTYLLAQAMICLGYLLEFTAVSVVSC